MPTYAYNAPRPAFDRLLDERADELGVKRARVRAKIERVDRKRIATGRGDALAGAVAPRPAAGFARGFHGTQPALCAHAGNSRGSRPAQGRGLLRPLRRFRRDRQPRGQVIIGRLARGWCWRIPLRDCLSVGVVMNKDDAAQFGTTPEERLEGVIDHDPLLAAAGRNRRRLTEVATYTNYQLISRRGHGPGWVMTGDALGFVDPMLSPGMWLALHSAELLAERLDNLPAYTREMRKLIKAWMGLIQYFYDGRIFAMYKTGMFIRTEISRQDRRDDA